MAADYGLRTSGHYSFAVLFLKPEARSRLYASPENDVRPVRLLYDKVHFDRAGLGNGDRLLFTGGAVVPRGHGVGAGREVVDAVPTVDVGRREVRMAEDEDEGAHVRVNVAEHSDDAG